MTDYPDSIVEEAKAYCEQPDAHKPPFTYTVGPTERAILEGRGVEVVVSWCIYCYPDSMPHADFVHIMEDEFLRRLNRKTGEVEDEKVPDSPDRHPRAGAISVSIECQ